MEGVSPNTIGPETSGRQIDYVSFSSRIQDDPKVNVMPWRADRPAQKRPEDRNMILVKSR